MPAIDTGLTPSQVHLTGVSRDDDDTAPQFTKNPYYRDGVNLLRTMKWVHWWIVEKKLIPMPISAEGLLGVKPQTLRLWFYGARAASYNEVLVASLASNFPDVEMFAQILDTIQNKLSVAMDNKRRLVVIRYVQQDAASLIGASMPDLSAEFMDNDNRNESVGESASNSTASPVSQLDMWIDAGANGEFHIKDMQLSDDDMATLKERSVQYRGIITVVVTRQWVRAMRT